MMYTLTLYKTMNNIIESISPAKHIHIPSSHVIRDPWMTRGLITSSRTLNKLHTKKRGKAKTHPANLKYVTYRNVYNCLKRKAKLKYYNNLFNEYQSNIKKTWDVINTLICRTNI